MTTTTLENTIARLHATWDTATRCAAHPGYRQGLCAACDTEETNRRQAAHQHATRADAARRAANDCDTRFPPRFRNATADNPQVREWITHATCHPAPSSLFLLGPTGVGKTWQAYGALRALATAGTIRTWHALTAADMAASLRPHTTTDTETVLATYRTCDLLLIDDLGALKPSEWVEEITYRLLNSRYENLKTTIFTSNLPPSHIRENLGDRITSRLSEMCQRIALEGTDRRRATNEPNHQS